MLSNKNLKIIYERTNGRCHFCGDKVEFEKYGLKNVEDIKGVWEADHIHQKGKGGSKYEHNCLPACYRCNRLRWHRRGNDLRELLFLGLIASDQIKKRNGIGKTLIKLRNKRMEQNKKRRQSGI